MKQKGQVVEEDEIETIIDINVSAYISNDYISDENQKIDMYKKISSIVDKDDLADLIDEFTDRFGDIPQEVMNLLDISYIRRLARLIGFSNIQEKNDTIIMYFRNDMMMNL